MSAKRILIVEDESSLRTALFRVLERKGFQVVTASTVAEAQVMAKTGSGFSIALLDVCLPDGDGIQLMQDLKRDNPDIQPIILTGNSSVELAVEATKKGAFHFISKPFNLDEFISLVERAAAHTQLSQENRQLREELHGKYKFDNIIGQSEGIRNVLDLVSRVASSDSNVLVTGESGTGKELIAKAIHYNSDRAAAPFVPINCGAIPAELLESELFGHVKGAFTGAINARSGRFELAEGGTIFLDEIGDMSPNLQVKLLRVLQERIFEPVGSSKSHQADVRVIAATNIDLEKAVEEGKFREDLFYRLNVIPIHIPSLRERSSDIPILLDHFRTNFNSSKGRELEGFSPDALETLCSYKWPGNIRELENLVERLSILRGNGTIQLGALPEKYRQQPGAISKPARIDIPEEGMDFNSAVDKYENTLILQALEKTGWNRNQAAILLRLNRTTLVEKIKKKGLTPPEVRA